ncbi:MAG: GGDEF domain-containing protein [Planctomycetota bacterium]|nr:MAG: GGDEF domain-containing protein [Planctomycetota bacterium]
MNWFDRRCRWGEEARRGRSGSAFDSESAAVEFLGGVVLGVLLAVGFELTRRRARVGPATAHRAGAPALPDAVQQRRLLDSVQRLTALADGAITRHCQALKQVNEKLSGSDGSGGDLHEAIAELLEANARLRSALMVALESFRAQQRQLERLIDQARTDALTELANRRAFDLELSRLFAQRQRQGIVFSLLLIDLDRFKQVNDRFGHLVGDRVLRDAATLLRTHLREMDFVARYGGEEFAAILPGTELRQAVLAAERIRECIAAHEFTTDGSRLRLTTCVGVATVRSGEIAETLVQRADVALYAAKAAGRNRTFVHDGHRCVGAVEFLRASHASESETDPRLDAEAG